MNLWSGITALALTLYSSMAVEIIGHRGASYDAPENTLAAFKLAYAHGADAAELDIHLTKDGRIAVIHDPDLKRVGGIDLKIAGSSWSDVRQANVGAFDKWQGKGLDEKVPELSEVLKLVPAGKKLYIEIKVHDEILAPLQETIAQSGLKPAQLPIITFYYDVAKAAKQRFPRHEVYWLHSYAKDKETGRFPELGDLIQKAKDANLDGLDLQSKFPVDSTFVKQVHAAGLKLATWTVDDPEVARAEADAGVDAITTNRPKWLREQLKN